MDSERRAALAQAAERRPNTVLVSAATGEGIDRLLGLIEDRLAGQGVVVEVVFSAGEGGDAAWVYDHAEVLDRSVDDDGSLTLTARFAADKLGLAERRLGDRLRPMPVVRRAAAE